MDRTKALDHFNWWFAQAHDCLLLSANPLLRNSRYLALCCLQQSAEFTFKAVIDSLTGRQVKSRNPYALMNLAVLHVPAIHAVFPRNSSFEKKLFHYLKPAFILMRGDEGLIPSNEELEILITRIRELQTVVKAVCLQKIDFPEGSP